MIPDLIKFLCTFEDNLTEETVYKSKKQFAKKYKQSLVPTNIQLRKEYNKLLKSWEISKNSILEHVLVKRKIRSLSWIVPVQVLTKPYSCPGQCIFCPTESIMPKSYISTEPWATRALLNKFDPVNQVFNRLLSLYMTWHDTDKIEMIVLGGTWDSYPEDYKIDFIKWLYDACNTFEKFLEKFDIDMSTQKAIRDIIVQKWDLSFPDTLEESQNINESAKNRIIWLTLETRPDMINHDNAKKWRELGVTRIEVWVQSVFDDILIANKRWHTLDQTKNAIYILRQYWFKFCIHIMPWLYKSDFDKDIQSFQILFDNSSFRPDEVKFYPTSVLPNTELYELYKQWKYKPIASEQTTQIIRIVKQDIIPPYTRIKRLIRDIPSTEIISWSNITNLRQLCLHTLQKEVSRDQILQKKYLSRLYKNSNIINEQNFIEKTNKELSTTLKKIYKYFETNEESTIIIWDKPEYQKIAFPCICTRCREIRNYKPSDETEKTLLIIRKYISSVWDEYFISWENNYWYLIWFARLLLPYKWKTINISGLWENTAILRELHVYWKQEKIWAKWIKAQHTWFGKKLIFLSEQIATSNWYRRLSIISWIGVMGYYKKLWYLQEGTYMVKNI